MAEPVGTSRSQEALPGPWETTEFIAGAAVSRDGVSSRVLAMQIMVRAGCQ